MAEHGFVSDKTKYYEFIKADKTYRDKWDVKRRILQNIKAGVESSDAKLLSKPQYMIIKLIFDSKYFDLNNAIIEDPSTISGFKKLDWSAYLPEDQIFKYGDYIFNSKGNRFIPLKYKDGKEFRSRDEFKIE